MSESVNAFLAVGFAAAVAAPAIILGAASNARRAACKLLAYADARDAFSARYKQSHEAYADQFNLAAPVAKGASFPATTEAEALWVGPPTLPAAEQNTAKRRAFLATLGLAALPFAGIIGYVMQEVGK